MKTTANGTTAAQVNNNETKNAANTGASYNPDFVAHVKMYADNERELYDMQSGTARAHIEENTGLHFEEIHKGQTYAARPEKWEQVAALLLTYNWLTRYYNCAHRENVLVLRADCNTPAAATLYYKQDGRELVGIRGAY